MRVLLVEDDRMIADAMERGLHAAAYAVERVDDGVRALTAFDGQTYDLVLLDPGTAKERRHRRSEIDSS